MTTTTKELFGRLTCADVEAWVTHSPGGLNITPHEIPVCAGFDITIHLAPEVEIGNAKTRPKSGTTADWLKKENEAPDKIVIKVPRGLDTKLYQFKITIKGVGTIDPGVRVV